MTNSGDLQRSNFAILAVACSLALLAMAAAWLCYHNGWILFYGDAESHLNISRALVDSRTPDYNQLGTVWLPVLHVLCMPFVRSDALWRSGLAGTIPVAVCFVIAGSCFFLAALDLYRSRKAALVTVACFALNPNVLYLAAIPMTEIVFLAGVSVVVLSVLRFERTQRVRWIGLAVAASWLLSLTRYDGWFLIPFLAIWLAVIAKKQRWLVFVAFAALASLAPLYWCAHNWYLTGNALDFYNGPYSARAIQGGHWYPGLHDWLAAARYYFTACRLCTGNVLIIVGFAGALAAMRLGTWRPLLFLSLTPLFYIWSMHSSAGTPIFVPSLWPFSYYNTRYGIAAVPLCAMAAGALAIPLKRVACLLPLFAITPWLFHPAPQNWICWKESQVNSDDRRAWTELAATYIRQRYQPGECILASSGDVTGVFRVAGIPLRDTLNIGNGPEWFAATRRPDLFHPCEWAILQSGDALSHALARGPYSERLSITTGPYSPDLLINRREHP